MDVGSQLIPLAKAFWWFIPLFMLSSFLSSSVGKGLIGEWRVRLLLRRSLDRKSYRRLHDVTLSTHTGSSQYDHILISLYGIFVIETKHMSGWIFGQADQKYWTQKSQKKSLRFQNPLHLNVEHTRNLMKSLGLSNNSAHSIVCFIGTQRFKSPMPENITSSETLLAYIKSFTVPIFTEEQVRTLYKTIQQDRLAPTWESHVQNIAHLQSRQIPKTNPPCPGCGNLLVLFSKGSCADKIEKIWRCSSFPKCKVTQNVNQS